MENKTEIDIAINETLVNIRDKIHANNSELETLLSLPIDFLKSKLNKDGLLAYTNIRTELIHTLEMVEVLVYDTHVEAPKCFKCGAEAKVVKRKINGMWQEYLNGEFTHWLENGKLIHSFECDDCIKNN